MRITATIRLALSNRAPEVLRVLHKNFLHPSGQRDRCWGAEPAFTDCQMHSEAGIEDEDVTFGQSAGDEPRLTAIHPTYLMEIRAAPKDIGLRSLAQGQKNRNVGPMQ